MIGLSGGSPPGEGPAGPVARARLSRRARSALAAAVLLAAVAVAIALGAGPSSGPSTGSSSAVDPILLGQPLPLTGDSRTSGAEMRIAGEMAVEQANAAGGVEGQPIELVTIDDACDPQTAVAAATELVRRKVALSVGGYCSSATLPTVSIFQEAGIPMVLPASNSDDLLKTGYGSLFLLNGTGTQEAGAALRWIAELGAQRVALVHDGTSYSSNIATVAAGMLTTPRPEGAPAQSHGLRLSTMGRLTQGATEHRKIADRVISSRADAVYFTGYVAEAGRLIRDLRAAGYHGVIMIADGCVDQALLQFAEGTAEGVYATMPPIAEHLSLPPGWSQEFARRSGHPPGPYTVQAYDAVTLAVDALRRADSRDGAAVTRALAATNGLELLTGPARFAADHTLEGFAFHLLRVRSGRFDMVTSGDLPVSADPGSA